MRRNTLKKLRFFNKNSSVVMKIQASMGPQEINFQCHLTLKENTDLRCDAENILRYVPLPD